MSNSEAYGGRMVPEAFGETSEVQGMKRFNIEFVWIHFEFDGASILATSAENAAEQARINYILSPAPEEEIAHALPEMIKVTVANPAPGELQHQVYFYDFKNLSLENYP